MPVSNVVEFICPWAGEDERSTDEELAADGSFAASVCRISTGVGAGDNLPELKVLERQLLFNVYIHAPPSIEGSGLALMPREGWGF